MRIHRTAAALVAAASLLPAAASAADTSMHAMNAMHAAPAQMVCRHAAAGEHGNAMMMADKAALVCKPLPAAMTMSPTMHDKFGPAIGAELSPAQVNAAWQKWVQTQLEIPAVGGG